MEKRILTDRTLRALKPAEQGKRYDVWDAIVPGLAVRVTASGHKSFVLIARYGSTNPTRGHLGNYGALTLEMARTKARHWLELIGKGLDPRNEEEKKRAAELRKQANTFAAVAEDFISDKLSTESRGKDAERDIRRELLPRWGKLPVTEITDQQVSELIKATAKRIRAEKGSKATAFQAHALLATTRRLFSWAIDQRCYGLQNSPCDRLRPKSLIGEKPPRSRILNDAEMAALWKASETIGYPYGQLYRLLALTGQRKSEVAKARWPEFDLAKKVWIIPAARMKRKAGHVVPLSEDAIAILKSLPRFTKGDHLFSTDFGVKPVNGFSRAKVKLDEGIAAELGGKVEPFVIHDIRRTMRTGLSALPVPDLVRELVIAHTKPGLHKVYDLHAYEAEKRRALDLWATKLRTVTGKRSGKVVALRGAVS